jgi:hypothetical protein
MYKLIISRNKIKCKDLIIILVNQKILWRIFIRFKNQIIFWRIFIRFKNKSTSII